MKYLAGLWVYHSFYVLSLFQRKSIHTLYTSKMLTWFKFSFISFLTKSLWFVFASVLVNFVKRQKAEFNVIWSNEVKMKHQSLVYILDYLVICKCLHHFKGVYVCVCLCVCVYFMSCLLNDILSWGIYFERCWNVLKMWGLMVIWTYWKCEVWSLFKG